LSLLAAACSVGGCSLQCGCHTLSRRLQRGRVSIGLELSMLVGARFLCLRLPSLPVLAAGVGEPVLAARVVCLSWLPARACSPRPRLFFALACCGCWCCCRRASCCQSAQHKQAVAQSAWQLGLEQFPHIVGCLRGHNVCSSERLLTRLTPFPSCLKPLAPPGFLHA
jgi:hypothetical protein